MGIIDSSSAFEAQEAVTRCLATFFALIPSTTLTLAEAVQHAGKQSICQSIKAALRLSVGKVGGSSRTSFAFAGSLQLVLSLVFARQETTVLFLLSASRLPSACSLVFL